MERPVLTVARPRAGITTDSLLLMSCPAAPALPFTGSVAVGDRRFTEKIARAMLKD